MTATPVSPTLPILVLHGPNLHLLGVREPEVYGTQTLAELNALLEADAAALGVALTILQSNHEGQLIDWLSEYRRRVRGVLFNPGGYTHTSVALLDTVRAIAIPVVEVHLSEPKEREAYRRISYVGEGCVARFAGQGGQSYRAALRWLAEHLRAES